jgi:nucleotide-binding universal stress UspA family protein
VRLLVALDLQTEGHHWLMDQGSRVAAMSGGTLDLLYVQTDPTVSESQLKSFQHRLDEMARLIPVELRGETRIVAGDLIPVLSTESRSYEGMVVGPREPGAFERLFKGTIATRVMREAQCPVVIPRHTGEKPVKAPKCLVGLDLNKSNTDWMLAQASDWVSAMGGTVDAAFVDEKPPVAGIRNADIRLAARKEWELVQAKWRRVVQAGLDRMDEQVRGEPLILSGDPAVELVGQSKNYDYVIVGNLEHTGLRGYLLGSVASHVIRNAQCDVITLPAAAYLKEHGK